MVCLCFILNHFINFHLFSSSPCLGLIRLHNLDVVPRSQLCDLDLGFMDVLMPCVLQNNILWFYVVTFVFM
jgi:hypothetical protein